MKIKTRTILLVIIFILNIVLQTVFSLNTPEFSSSESYDVLRNVESIKETGFPIINDEQNIHTIPVASPPLFYYIIALFSFIFPTYLMAKILPAIFISFLPIIVFLIANNISRNKNVSLFSAFMAGFIPIISTLTVNKLSPYSLAIPLIFLSFYFLLKIKDNKKYATFSIIAFVLAILSHPIAIMFLVAYMIYFILLRIEKINIENIELEVIGFKLFFTFWCYFVIYKKILLEYGPEIIWKNIPAFSELHSKIDISIFQAIFQIGIIPFIFGLLVTYLFFSEYKNKTNNLFIALIITPFILLVLGLASINVTLTFLGIVLILLFSIFYKSFLIKIEKTKFSKHKLIVIFILLGIFILTSAIPTLKIASDSINNAFDNEDIKTAEWIKENTENNSTILTTAYEGNFIAYKTGRKITISTNEVKTKNYEIIKKDVDQLYTSVFQNNALQLIEKYKIDYIIISDRSLQEYNISTIPYTKNKECFKVVYDEYSKIIEPICILTVEKID